MNTKKEPQSYGSMKTISVGFPILGIRVGLLGTVKRFAQIYP